jgi:thiol:disulfide interchange protein
MAVIKYFIGKRAEFVELLKAKQTHFILVFQTCWCTLCKTPRYQEFIQTRLMTLPDNYTLYVLDADEFSDVFSFLKSKKMVVGVPTILFYHRDNVTYVPDESISGINAGHLESFYNQIQRQP